MGRCLLNIKVKEALTTYVPSFSVLMLICLILFVSGVRPFGVSLLVAGYDDKGPQLYQVLQFPLSSFWNSIANSPHKLWNPFSFYYVNFGIGGSFRFIFLLESFSNGEKCLQCKDISWEEVSAILKNILNDAFSGSFL